MNKKRLFTFGCSHTSYFWPSWAEILSLGFDEFYNFGLAGSGDFRILNQIQRTKERFQFTKNDYVGIALSCNFRYDIIHEKKKTWIGLGSMSDEQYHRVKFIRELNDFGGNENKLTCIKAMKKELDDSDVNYKIFQTFNLYEGESGVEKKVTDEIKSLCDANLTMYDYAYPYGPVRCSYKVEGELDGHWIIPIHLELVKNEFSDWYDEKHNSVVMGWHKRMPKDNVGVQKQFHWLRYKQYQMVGPELVNPQYNGIQTTI
jgi:hypothetical protein